MALPSSSFARTSIAVLFALAFAGACEDSNASPDDGANEDGGSSRDKDSGTSGRDRDASSAAGKGGKGGSGTGGGGSGTGGTSGAGGTGGDGGQRDAGTTAGTAEVVRTLAYHQISAFTASPNGRPVFSGNGQSIVYPNLVRAGTAVFLHGLEDLAGSWIAGKHALRDDAMGVDETADDGVFAGGQITSGDGGEVGERIVRIKAESKASDGRRHATAIDVSGLSVE